MRMRIAVSFELPEGATRDDALAYVMDAVQTWKGSLRPDGWSGSPDSEGDPMFYLDSDTVSASYVTAPGKKRKTVRLIP